ncbi:Alpha/Beta hydrolase protein [Cunninghamella echinulata]|nr:Alpha/Beta hydrolase protein [Cunninghamella echinulata]
MDPTFEFFNKSIQTTKYLKNKQLFEQRKQQAQPSVLTKMMNRPQYSQSLAYTLSVASKLGYEDLEIIKYELNQAGFDVENTFRPFAYKNICAYVIEKEDMIFLIFRGSNPLNIQNYLTNIDIRMRDVYANWGYMGRVHKGYFDALGDPFVEKINEKETYIEENAHNKATIWQSLKQIFSNYLDQLSGHWMHQLTDPVDFRFLASQQHQQHYINQRELTMYHQAESYILDILHQDKNKKLYVSGHSLGASLGTMFVAKMVQSSSPLLNYFHGLYTFGQPKLGDVTFSKIFDAKLSSKIFHHVYNNDIFTRLPSYSKYATPPGTLVFIESSYDITIYPPDPYTNEPTSVRPISQLHLSGLLNRHVLKRLSEESWIRILFRVLAPYMINDHFASEYPKSLKHGQVKWVILGETIDDPHSNTGLTHRPTMMKRKSKIDVSEKDSMLKTLS